MLDEGYGYLVAAVRWIWVPSSDSQGIWVPGSDSQGIWVPGSNSQGIWVPGSDSQVDMGTW